MFLVYLIVAFIFLATVKGMIKAIKTKKVRELFIYLLFLPFQFFFVISILLGGGAIHDAANDYELYQAGHYYLVSHGHWTEVSYGTYVFVLVSEIVGILTFVVAFVLNLVRVFSVEDSN